MRIGRNPQWPDYFEKQYPDRRLAILEGNILYVEHIGAFTVKEYTYLVKMLFNMNLMTYTESLTSKLHFPYLFDGVHSKSTDISCNKEGDAITARIYNASKQTRWIVPTSIWDLHVQDDLFKTMRGLFSYYRVGVKPTPGSIGRAVLRRFFYLNHEPKHTAPNTIALNYLQLHGYGGRCDTLVQPYKISEYVYPVLLALDMASGYLAHFMKLPTGTSHWFISGNVQPYFTYFGECDVVIHKELALGPFPVRTGKKGTKIVYPTLPGKYHTYLWKEQVERARQMDCTVTIKNGIGWTEFTTATTDFCRYMHYSRFLHTGTPLEYIDKKIAVSTIGGFGMKQTYYHLTGEDQEHLPAKLDDNGLPLDMYIEEYNDYKQPSMVHWRDYCIMLCNLALFDYALPYAEQGRLIMTNYDELLIVERDERSRYVRKHSLEAMMSQMGDLRWQELTNVKVYSDRSLECDQKRVRPGVPLEV